MQTIRITKGNWTRALPVIERVHADRSAGQYSAGWLVAHGDREYFVDDDGTVWTYVDRFGDVQSEQIGTAPDVKAAADKLERLLATAP